jgi:hypothetical protein
VPGSGGEYLAALANPGLVTALNADIGR